MFQTPTTPSTSAEKVETSVSALSLCQFTWEEKIQHKKGETLAYIHLLEKEKHHLDKLTNKTFKTAEDEALLVLAEQRYRQIQTKVEMLKVAQEIFELLTNAHKQYQLAFFTQIQPRGLSLKEAQSTLHPLNQTVSGLLDKLIKSLFESTIKTFILIKELPSELLAHLDKPRFKERAAGLIQLLDNYHKTCLFKKVQAQRTSEILSDQLSSLKITNPLFAKVPATEGPIRERSLSLTEDKSPEVTKTPPLKRTFSTSHCKK